MAITHRPNKEGYRLCPACLPETPAVLSVCVNCKGYLITHGWRKRIKITVTSFDEPERHPNDDEVKDHVKQTWEKIKIDLTSDDDEAQEKDDEKVEMGDGGEEVKVDEEEEFNMDDLNAEKRGFGEQDEVDDYINKEREEVEDGRGGDPRWRDQSPQIQSWRDARRSGISCLDEPRRVWIEGITCRSLHDRRRSA